MQFEHDSAGNRLRCFLSFLSFPLFFPAWWISCLFPLPHFVLVSVSFEKKSFSLLLHREYLVYSGGAAERLSHRQERRPEEPTT